MTATRPALPTNVIRSTQRELWKESRAPGSLGEKYRSRSLPVGKLFPLRAIGMHLEELEPGRCSCQLHYHMFEEEQFYLLEGSLTVRELWGAAERYVEYVAEPGDLIAYAPGTKIAHQFFNRGAETARFVAFSTRHPGDVCLYPDSGKVLLRGCRAGGVLIPRGETRGAADLQALAARAAASRSVSNISKPSHVVSAAPWVELDGGAVSARALSRAAGGRGLFASEQRVLPGQSSSELEYRVFAECLVIVQSEGLLLRQVQQGSEQCILLLPGDVVHWPPNEPIAHQLRNTAQVAATYLLISDEPAHDIACLADTGDFRVPALGQQGKIEALDYWVGA